MKIRKWMGLMTAASPYALPAGAAAEQANLQILKPGQLTPRPGMEDVGVVRGGNVLALQRQAVGGGSPDRLFDFRANFSYTPTGGALTYNYSVGINTADNAGVFTPRVLGTFESTSRIFPSFAQDRHGSAYIFYGNGKQPSRYLHGSDVNVVDMGLTAPTVAPQVTPLGDGWFIERVDVLSSGTSYYTPPTLTVTGGNPDRAATLRAVVQAGSIVAVDVVDGGSNYKAIPTITVSSEQLGTGFLATGVLATSEAVYGFKDTTAASSVTNSYNSGFTHSFDLSIDAPKIAYKSGATTAFVTATFDPVNAEYVALVPLTPVSPATGSQAFAEVKFNPISAAYRLGTGSGVQWQTGSSSAYTTATGSTFADFRAARVNWYTGTGNNYFENTQTPCNKDYTDTSIWKYYWYLNRDGFWALMPDTRARIFAKSQLDRITYSPGSAFTTGKNTLAFGDYYYPYYGYIGYRVLVGAETQVTNEQAWSVNHALVQVDANGRPFVDITLKPAAKSDGTARAVQTGTAYPVIRVYLNYCPESWMVNNSFPGSATTPQDYRYTPQSGIDRRANASDTGTGTGSTSTPSGIMDFYYLNQISGDGYTLQDTRTRWWNAGFAGGNTVGWPASNSSPYTMRRPVVDIRIGEGSDTGGLANNSIQVISPGALLEQGTKFAIRFEQYNSFDYRVANSIAYERQGVLDYTWLTSVAESRRWLPTSVGDFERRGAWNAAYTDFYFEANALDSSTTSQQLLLPGPIKGTPRVVLTGSGWSGTASQSAEFTLRQRTTTVTATPTYTDSVTYRWPTEVLIPAATSTRIGTVTTISKGTNYFREPTILFRGGGGYGLRTQATVSGGQVTSVVVTDGGDGFTGNTTLYTDVQPAKLLPILRGTMRGTYRCAYRFADYRQTVVVNTTISITSGQTSATLASAAGVKPGMQITGVTGLRHLVKIVSVAGNTVELSHPATATAASAACVVRDMSQPIVYSDFSPITDVDASANSSGRSATLAWALAGVQAPLRAEFVEFFRTSADQSLVFYRLDQYGTVSGGVVSIQGTDGLSDEELFDVDRPAYAALPVVLPNGGLNAYRFGVPRSDMSVCVAWEDRLWYGVSTSGQDINTVFFSELDEFESCPDLNELPIQGNLRGSDYLTALVPFGSILLAMQNAHSYSVSYNTDPSVDPVITLVAHRGCLNHRCWDICDDLVYAADERGVYSMSRSGDVQSLSEPVRDFFTENKLDWTRRDTFYLKVDQANGLLRLFVSLAGQNSNAPTMALCYHVANKMWWVEHWPNSLLCATEHRSQAGRDRIIYGSRDGAVYEFSGARDYPFSDIISVAVTNGGSGYITPPTVTAGGAGSGAELRALIANGAVTEVVIVRGGFGYGTVGNDGTFNSAVPLTFSAPPSGTTATGDGVARSPNVGTVGSPVFPRSSVPFAIRTGPMALVYEASGKGGDRQMDRAIIVTYRPTTADKTLLLREYYNNSGSPRPNVMRRDRGTGFVHETNGARTTLNMAATRSPLGLSTGLAKATFAGRSLDDVGSADRHIAVELSCTADDALAAVPPEPLIYELEVRGVEDGGQ